MIEMNELIEMAESLPIDLKMQLIDRLLKSLTSSQREIEELWSEEAERRVRELKEGKVTAIPGEAVFQRIHERLAP